MDDLRPQTTEEPALALVRAKGLDWYYSFAADARAAGPDAAGGQAEGLQRVAITRSQVLVLTVLEPEDVMQESNGCFFGRMRVLAVQTPKIEREQSGQDYQVEFEHNPR